MFHRIFEDEDGNTVQEFDEEAIDYFIQGLEELRDLEPGSELSTPSVEDDADGVPNSVQELILRRVSDDRS